ncbi:hypothetical protein ACINWC743_A0431 [Acinetobacter sp. WC-743]|nr:hypothetical protein ACINWC743_A0431 [Acinetobacter sp. WC-743]
MGLLNSILFCSFLKQKFKFSSFQYHMNSTKKIKYQLA